MALETGTFVNDLVTSNPPGSDQILQGDNHLRLIKTVLKNTFPNADKADYLFDAVVKTGNYTVLTSDMHKFITVDASGGAVSITLPAMAASDDGWFIVVQKSDASANAVTVVGTINGAANLSLSSQYVSALVWWNGSAWFAFNSAALASTTDVLTGTNTSKVVTPDALAALWEQGSDIASAGTISVGEGGYFNVTGTTTITDIDFATDKAGRKVWLKFAGALTLTHNSTTLILPGGANITTAAGDTACFVSEGSDNVRCLTYHRAVGGATQAQQEAGTDASSPVTPSVQQYHPSAIKVFAFITYSGSTPTLVTSYNMTSITDTGVGRCTATFDRDFSSANWSGQLTNNTGASGEEGDGLFIRSMAAGSCELTCVNSGYFFADPSMLSFMAAGDQA